MIIDNKLSAIKAAEFLGTSVRNFYALAKKNNIAYCELEKLRMYSGNEILKLKENRDQRAAVCGELAPIKLPSWTLNLPNKTRMSCKDIYKFFGYKSVDNLYNRIYNQKFPKSVIFSIRKSSSPRFGTSKLNYWTLGLLRDYQAEQNQRAETGSE